MGTPLLLKQKVQEKFIKGTIQANNCYILVFDYKWNAAIVLPSKKYRINVFFPQPNAPVITLICQTFRKKHACDKTVWMTQFLSLMLLIGLSANMICFCLEKKMYSEQRLLIQLSDLSISSCEYLIYLFLLVNVLSII